MKKLEICNNCLFFSRYKTNNSLKLKNGYCLYPNIDKKQINEKCEYKIPYNN